MIEQKSFSKAAKTVHITQPTVSSHIRDLEEHFGCSLIDRFSRHVMPTRAGEILYSYARKLISLRDEAETAMAEFHGTIKGKLHIGGSTIPGTYILPRMAGEFCRANPDVTISLKIGDSGKMAEDILEGFLEMAVVGAVVKDKRLVQKIFMEDEMCLIVPSGHALAGEEMISLDTLVKTPFIIREKGSGTRKSLSESLKEAGISLEDLNIVSEMGSTAAVSEGVKSGMGISILSYIAVKDLIRLGYVKIVPVQNLLLKRYFYITSYRNKTPSPLSRAFTEFLLLS